MTSRNLRNDRKVFQLSAQVQRSLAYALAESGDALISELYVESVEPFPNASRLLVRVHHPEAGRTEILERLERLRGHLRSQVASSIHRKKTPELLFELAVLLDEVDPWD